MLVITGAQGFIGSNIVAALNAREREDVVAVDTYADHRSPAAGAARERNLAGLSVLDRVDQDDLPAWLEKFGNYAEALIHLGACSDTTVQDREYVMRNNFEYTRTLWQWCTRARRPFVYASSAATYGDGSQGYDDEADPRALRPLNLYGESKQRFDLWALEQTEAPPRWAGLKYFNVFGPREQHKGRMASVAFHVFQQVRREGQARLFESDRPEIPHGGQRRDFVYVRDAVDVTLFFLTAPVSATAPNGLYNAGTGQARTFADLAKAVFAALGLEPRIEYFPMPADLRGKYQYFTQARVAKLRRAGFTRPFHSLEEGVREYVQDYLLKEPPA